MIASPCKDCKDRKLSCHSVCEKYLKFKNELAELKEKIAKARAGRPY